MSPTWKGSTDLSEAPNSPSLKTTKDAQTCTRRFLGSWAKVLSEAPSPGQEMDGYTGYIITGVDQDHADGGSGILVITAAKTKAQSDGLDTEHLPDPSYESDWVEVQKSLREHPIYRTGGTKALTTQDLADLAFWETIAQAHPDRYRDQEVQRTSEGAWVAMSDNAKHLATRLLRQQDSYNVYVHRVLRTRYYKSRPAPAATGIRQAPPIWALSGRVYVKNADRIVSGTPFWQRTEEWLGFDQVDTDIVP